MSTQKQHVIKIAHNKTKVFTTRSTLRVVSSPNPTEEFSKHYKLGSVLGKGSFATVFQATHLETGDQVAVKAIGFGYSPNTQQQQQQNDDNNKKNPPGNTTTSTTPEQQQKIVMEQVEREINFFSNVPPHPNIIRAREVFTTSSLLHGALSPDSLLNPQDAAALAKAAVASPAAVPLASSSGLPNSANSSTTTTPLASPPTPGSSFISSHQYHQQTFIVLELAAGGDLFDIIVKKQGLPEDESRCIFRQLTSAVHHMHSYGFAHSDLKPENILLMAENSQNNNNCNSNDPNSSSCCGCKCLDAEGNPIAKPHVTIKVEDFGFTRNKSDFYVAPPLSIDEEQQEQLLQNNNTDEPSQQQQANVLAAPLPPPAPRAPLLLTRQECQGSFAFVSPEKISVARGKLYAFDAFAADVWSTGVILFMTISACDPFTNSNPAAHGGRTTFDNIVCGGFKRSSKVWAIKGALDLITQMFTVDTSKRAITAEQVAEHEWMQGAENWRLEDFIVNDVNNNNMNNNTNNSNGNNNTNSNSTGSNSDNNNNNNNPIIPPTNSAISNNNNNNSTAVDDLKTSVATTAAATIAAFNESIAAPTASLSPATQLMMELVTEQIQNNEITISVDNKNGVVNVAESGPLLPLLPAPAPIVQVPLAAVANMIIQQQQNSRMSLQSNASSHSLYQHDSPNNTVVIVASAAHNEVHSDNDDDNNNHIHNPHDQESCSSESNNSVTPPPASTSPSTNNNNNNNNTAVTAVVG